MFKLSYHEERNLLNYRGVVLIVIASVSLLVTNVLNQKKGPAEGKLTTPAIEGTEEIQVATDTVRKSILTTQDLQDEIEYARVKALFDEVESESKARQKIDAEDGTEETK